MVHEVDMCCARLPANEFEVDPEMTLNAKVSDTRISTQEERVRTHLVDFPQILISGPL